MVLSHLDVPFELFYPLDMLLWWLTLGPRGHLSPSSIRQIQLVFVPIFFLRKQVFFRHKVLSESFILPMSETEKVFPSNLLIENCFQKKKQSCNRFYLNDLINYQIPNIIYNIIYTQYSNTRWGGDDHKELTIMNFYNL